MNYMTYDIVVIITRLLRLIFIKKMSVCVYLLMLTFINIVISLV